MQTETPVTTPATTTPRKSRKARKDAAPKIKRGGNELALANAVLAAHTARAALTKPENTAQLPALALVAQERIEALHPSKWATGVNLRAETGGGYSPETIYRAFTSKPVTRSAITRAARALIRAD